VHYFAKASFFNNWDFFIEWMRERLESCYNKISFEDEKKIAKPIVDYIKSAIKLYDKYGEKYK
jgi:predicted HTH transcriptional regulator